MCCWCLLLTINRESYWVIQKNERIGRRASKILASFHQFLQTLQENRELVGSCWVFTKSFKEDEADFMETGGKNQRIYWQFQGGFQDVFKYFKFFFKRSEKSMEYFLGIVSGGCRKVKMSVCWVQLSEFTKSTSFMTVTGRIDVRYK